jgi:hypothetical protein
VQAFEREIPGAEKAARAGEMGQNSNQAQLDRVAGLMRRYENSAKLAYILAVPPATPFPESTTAGIANGDWRSIGQMLTQSIGVREIDPVVKLYASLGDAYRSGIAPPSMQTSIFWQIELRKHNRSQHNARFTNFSSIMRIHLRIACFCTW